MTFPTLSNLRPALCTVALAATLFLAPSSGSAQCPSVPAPNIASPFPPTDVCIPDGFGGLPIDYFDDYSWGAASKISASTRIESVSTLSPWR